MRAIGAVIAFYSAVTVGTVIVMLAVPDGWLSVRHGLPVQSGAMLATALAVYAFIAWRGWAGREFFGWSGWREAVAGMGRALGLGVAMAAVAVALAVVAGPAGLTVTGVPLAAYARAVVPLTALLLVAALAEELLFRGYPLARLAATFGRVPASIGLAAAFALAHVWNPDTSALGLLNVGLASLVMSAAFFGSGRLAAAWGLHFGWNAGLGIGADAPVSGIRLEIPGIEYTPGAGSWYTGGAFGPEGGVVASLVMIAALAYLVRNTSRLTEDRTK